MTLLFPEVFPVLISTQAARFLPSGDILKLRSVCGAWKDAITSHFQNDPALLRVLSTSEEGSWDVFDESTHIPLCDSCCEDSYLFKSSENIQYFLSHFEKTHCQGTFLESRLTSPFISGCVHFIIFKENDGLHMLPEIANLVQKYGHHIFFLNLSILISFTEAVYLNLRRFLEFLPNLKMLRIQTWNYYHPGRIPQLENLVRQYPLPQLNHMRALKVETDLPLPVLNELIQRCGFTLKNLGIGTYPNLHWRFDVFSRVTLSNLTELKIYVDIDDHMTSLETMNDLPSLRKLCLVCGNGLEVVDWNRVFQLVSRFENQLTHLILKLRLGAADEYVKAYEHTRTSRLKLPFLKQAKITCMGLASLDFLIPCEKLENLTVLMRFKQYQIPWENLETEEIQFNSGFHGKLKQSNVWHHLPALKELELKVLTDRHRHKHNNHNPGNGSPALQLQQIPSGGYRVCRPTKV